MVTKAFTFEAHIQPTVGRIPRKKVSSTNQTWEFFTCLKGQKSQRVRKPSYPHTNIKF